MTQLTEHAKTILRAIADGKEIERLNTNGDWVPIYAHNAASHLGQGYADELRIKPEIRSINGREFAAPVEGGAGSCGFTDDMLWHFQELQWTEAKDRDTAYSAIVYALEGRTNNQD